MIFLTTQSNNTQTKQGLKWTADLEGCYAIGKQFHRFMSCLTSQDMKTKNTKNTQWHEVTEMGEGNQVFTTVKYAVTFLAGDCNNGTCWWRWLCASSIGYSGRCVSHRWRCRTCKVQVAVNSCGREGDKAWCTASSVAGDPFLVLGHPGINSGAHRLGTAKTKTHNSNLDPDRFIFGDQWPPWVSLWKEMGGKISVRKRCVSESSLLLKHNPVMLMSLSFHVYF